MFENLLAAYNPETGATVRKQTGSYYTPRAIVDYMADEALVATLSQKSDPTDGDAKLWDERLHYLLDYAQTFDDANEWFDDPETDAIVRAISELKILDPAVGSGAFPDGDAPQVDTRTPTTRSRQHPMGEVAEGTRRAANRSCV